jgi:DNA-binding CsgD family transcriptional regulator
VTRHPLRRDFTETQYAIVSRLGNGETTARIRTDLKLSGANFRYHLRQAAKKIPGTLPAQQKAVAWWRGASAKVLGAST